jgi:FkbM family methyltransferase
MKRKDRIKLDFTRNWKLPGKERLSNWLKPSDDIKSALKNGITWLSNEDIAIFTSADNYIEWSLLSTGTYEDEINKLIRISLKTGNIALDIGANIGLQSIRMSQCTGAEGKVYSFEPLAHLQEKFSNNIKLNKANNIKLFPFALANEESEADFKISKNTWNQGTFSIGNNDGGPDTQRVIIKIADNVPEIKELSRLDLVKIDVEGFEYEVLQGLKQTIDKYKPRIIFEYDSNYWLTNGQNMNDCFIFLNELHYTLYQITPVGCELVGQPAAIVSGNLFCMHQ